MEDWSNKTGNKAVPHASMDVEMRVTGMANTLSTVRKPSNVKVANLLGG